MKGVNRLDIHKYCKYCKYCKYQKILKYIEIYCKILRYINGLKIDNFQPVTQIHPKESNEQGNIIESEDCKDMVNGC